MTDRAKPFARQSIDTSRSMSEHARTVLIAGTASHVGKSTVAAGLCRLLADRGVDVAPFKAQNMSNNARAVPTSTGAEGAEPGVGEDVEPGAGEDVEPGAGEDVEPGVGEDVEPGVGEDVEPGVREGAERGFGEIGISQYVQARAARTRPETDHNPVLLKPRGEGESQLVVNGEAIAHYAAGDYYDEHWHAARDAAEAAYKRLAADRDVVIAEGAGSIAEINLHDRDLANVETARFADADILLVADVDRGGVFASLVGTLELLPADLRERVVGAVITKFRGDVSLLEPGVDEFEARTGVPVLGVLPYDDPGLPEEDSVALPPAGERAIHGTDDGVSEEHAVTVAVPRLPRISNATDPEPLAAEPGVRVAYVPLETDLEGADAVLLPGTKNTVDDLIACRDAGFDETLRRFEGPIVGLCGGYQLLGERIHDADVESAYLTADGTGASGTTVEAFGLLPIATTFDAEKRVVATELRLDADRAGPLRGVDDGELAVAGYEIHMGETRPVDEADAPSVDRLATPFDDPDGDRSGVALGAATERIAGTYLHGLFENEPVRRRFITTVREHAGIAPDLGVERETEARSAFDRAADLLRDHVDLGPLALPSDDGGTA